MWVSALKRLVRLRTRWAWAMLNGPRLLGLLCFITVSAPVLAGLGLRETLVLSSAGFSSLELTLSWIENPLGLSFGGRWEGQGFTYGEVGGSLSLDPLAISAQLGVEVGGAWVATLGASWTQAPFSFRGKLSFSAAGFLRGELGAAWRGDRLSLEGALEWEETLRALLLLTLNLERFSLRAGVDVGMEGIVHAQGGLDLHWDFGTVGLGLDFSPPTKELLFLTNVDLEGEHISLEFAAVWNPFPQESVLPTALVAESSKTSGLLRFLKEFKIRVSWATPEEGPAQKEGDPLAFISSPAKNVFVVGEDVFFSARGSRSTWPLQRVLWDFGDGARALGMDTHHQYAAPGIYQVKLYVWDQKGRLAQTERELRIIPPPISVDFSWEPKEPTLLNTVCFYVISQGEIVSWRWDFGDGSGSDQAAPCHRYQRKGTHPVSLTATDRYGNRVTVTKTLVVVNLPPQANPGGPYHGLVNAEIAFNGANSLDPDGRIVEFFWDFGDGTTARGARVSHAYRKPGVYRVCLRVTDEDGAHAEVCTTATVLSPPVVGGLP